MPELSRVHHAQITTLSLVCAGKLASTPSSTRHLAASAPSPDRSRYAEPAFDRLDDDVYAIVSARRPGGGGNTHRHAERSRTDVAADGRLSRTVPAASSSLSGTTAGGGSADRGAGTGGGGSYDPRARTFRQELADMRARTRQLLEQAAECERLSTILAARIDDEGDRGARPLSHAFGFEEQLL
jgi:hypothetical protein